MGVKCDEAKPECNRCIKNGHVCTGYERKRVFIHKSSEAIEEGELKLVRRPQSTSGKIPDRQLTRVEPGFPRLNNNAEVRSQLLASFVGGFLPSSRHLQDGKDTNILKTLPELCGNSPLLDRALLSLSSAFLAKQHKDDRLLGYSTKLYNNSMEIMHGKIKSGKGLGQDVLYTTVVFQLYELIHSSPPGFMAWIAHVQGSNAIIKQCRVNKKGTIAEKLFHRQLKFVTLCDAVGRRKAATLYEVLTTQERLSQGSTELEPIDELMDLLAECSALIEQVDTFIEQLPASPDGDKNNGEKLLGSCLSLEERLHQTCLKMQEKLGAPSTLTHDVPLREDLRAHLATSLFPDPFQFVSLACAESHLIYWATLIILYPLVDELLDVLGYRRNDVTPSQSCAIHPQAIEQRPLGVDVATDFTALAEHYADEVCRSVMYCTQSDMNTLGAQHLLAPFSQCAQFFQVHELAQKYRWCQGVFVLLDSLGLGIAPLLKDMVWPQYRSARLPSGNMLRRTLFSVRLTTQQLNAAECSSRIAKPAVFGSYRNVHRSARLPAITASEARRRPTLKPHQHSLVQARVNGPSPSSKRTIFIQTENTPNPDALKFIPNHRVLPENFPTTFLEYLSPRSTLAPPHPSPLAASLLNVDGVTSVFYGPDFITVTKATDSNWAHIKPEIFSLITQAVTSGEAIVNTVAKTGESGQEGGESESLAYEEEEDEVIGMIKELLDTRIRPAIQEDGGDIEFRGFENGIVLLKLRGACRTCDSSTVTLRNGIESMLMHYIEEVQGVEQVLDQEEEISMHEFAKFEEKLRQQKGAAATASTGGKGTLDSAP
ncbi:transcriptional regulator family: Fungal Specific TF [Aspergillus niger]|nr:transcriptional regulator family: Fungal Specific TF [Aspergillus niger]